jgi:hypothetical protein
MAAFVETVPFAWLTALLAVAGCASSNRADSEEARALHGTWEVVKITPLGDAGPSIPEVRTVTIGPAGFLRVAGRDVASPGTAGLSLHGEGFETTLYKNQFNLADTAPEVKLSVGVQRGSTKRLWALIFFTPDGGRSAIGSLHYVVAENDVGQERVASVVLEKRKDPP